jgi:putative CocE/NonD family hydrolase
MKTLKSFPFEVEILEHTEIPIGDGVRLAARIWRPKGSGPVPALLEYIPYRKRDRTRIRDSVNAPYFAGHGYAYVRVDIRGCGDSDGHLLDEYSYDEIEDGVKVIAWLAEQPWCNGKVGMLGISWGGFNALQVAARRPPALGAIATVCSTDETYTDNMHFMGGCLLSDNLSEATTMFAYQSLPPDPEVVGDRWRDMWQERLETSYPWLDPWLENQWQNDYWDRTSVARDYGAVECPVLAASGWADGFSNAVFRLMEHLDVPRQALIGPWRHLWPHMGEPGPAIGFLQIMIDWFDRHLGYCSALDKSCLSKVSDYRLMAWMQDSIPPSFSAQEERPGRWVAEQCWPPPRVKTKRLDLGRSVLSFSGEPSDPHLRQTLCSPLTVGLYAGKWCSYAGAPDLPGDQRDEDGGSLVYETESLEEDLEVLGTPILELEVAADQPVAQVAVRLSDVLPDGAVNRVSYGLCNLTHRNGHENPEPLIPGEPVKVKIPLNTLAQKFPAGNRIRLSISSSYWPLIWPSPKRATLTVFPGRSALELPVRDADAPKLQDPFPEPETAEPEPYTVISSPKVSWRVIRDLASNHSTLEVVRHDSEKMIDEINLRIRDYTLELYSSQANDLSTVRGETVTERVMQRDDWEIRVKTRTILTSDEESFRIHATLDAFEGEERVFSRTWTKTVQRRLV